MAEKLTVNSADSLSKAVSTINQRFRDSKYLVLTIRVGKDRSLDQNGLWFAMYQRIADMTQMGDVEEARKYCKLHYGVPIMRKEDVDFRAGWNRVFLSLDYETKLELMGPCAVFGPDGFPVTRLFSRAQGVAYTDAIAAEFSAKGVVFDDLLGSYA